MRPTILAIALTLLTSTAYADEASRAAKVEEYFKVARIEDTIRQTMDLVMKQMKSSVLQEMMGVTVSPEVEKKLDAFQEKIGAIMIDALAWDKLKSSYIKLFAEAFSDQELDDLLVFYKSPTGQSMVAKTPSLMVKANEVVQARMGDVISEIQKVTREFTSQMEEKASEPVRKK